jgi:hypothetical protein
MLNLPKYAIFDDWDSPTRGCVTELIEGKYFYMIKTGRGKQKGLDPKGSGCGPTDIKLFGFATNETTHSVRFERVYESSATYSDGKPRRWQDRTFGAEIGQSFELPRVRVKARKK